MKQDYTRLWNASSADGFLSAPFSIKELSFAIKQINTGKVQGLDNIPPEFLRYCGPKSFAWLSKFFSACLKQQSIPKIWQKAFGVAFSKPHKSPDDSRSCRSVSLLRVPYKILERLLLARHDPVVDPQLPEEQAGFRQRHSTT